LKRFRLIELLHNLGVHCANPCDALNETPLTHARRQDDPALVDLVIMLVERDIKVANLFYKNYLRQKAVKQYNYVRRKIIFLQTLYRKGFFASKNNDNDDDQDFDAENGGIVDSVAISSQFVPPPSAGVLELTEFSSALGIEDDGVESKEENSGSDHECDEDIA